MGHKFLLDPDAGTDPRAKAVKPSSRVDDLFLFVLSAAGLAAAGVSRQTIRAVRLGASVQGLGTMDKELQRSLSHLHVAHIGAAAHATSVATLHAEMARISTALAAVRQLPAEEIDLLVEQLQAVSAADEAASDLYQVRTTQEMADSMSLTLPVVYQREAAGEIFAVLENYRKTGRHFPAFQLNHKLNRPLLLKVIKAYRDADVNTTLLWSFLRTPQRIFDGLTSTEMLVGGMPQAYGGLKPVERAEAFLDVVAEELSRVRVQ